MDRRETRSSCTRNGAVTAVVHAVVMDVRTAALVPRRAATPEHARAVVARDGAALVSGIGSVDEAVAFGEAMLGPRVVKVRPQFEVTTESTETEAKIVTAQPADERGRKRYRVPLDGHQPAHNDGFGFGDFAPDHMFLYCERPCDVGGASFLVDALELLTMLSADAEFARFAWEQPIDHSMPNFPQGSFHPIARLAPGGRTQVRANPDQSVMPGREDTADVAMLQRWADAVSTARTDGAHFRAAAGELLCIDNYRMLHGRNGVVSPDRKMVSIWAWTTDAVAIPEGEMDIAAPNLAGLRPVG